MIVFFAIFFIVTGFVILFFLDRFKESVPVVRAGIAKKKLPIPESFLISLPDEMSFEDGSSLEYDSNLWFRGFVHGKSASPKLSHGDIFLARRTPQGSRYNFDRENGVLTFPDIDDLRLSAGDQREIWL